MIAQSEELHRTQPKMAEALNLYRSQLVNLQKTIERLRITFTCAPVHTGGPPNTFVGRLIVVHGVSENSLAGLKEADGIALGIGEPRERARWNGDGWHQHFPAERSRSVEISLNVIDLNVKNRVTVGLVAESRDVTRYRAARIDHGGGTGIVHLPIEQLGKEGLRLGAVTTADFKMNDGIRHDELPAFLSR